jgi:hypothetical protein
VLKPTSLVAIFSSAPGPRIKTTPEEMGMSADFEKMASEANLAHELRMAFKSQQQADRKQARLRLLDDAVAALTSDVIPLLEQAIVAFSRNGISAKMTRDFAIKECMEKDPSITFKCLGRVDGAQFEGPAACFSSDGAVITVGVAKKENCGAAEKLGSAPRGESEDLVAHGIQRTLNGLFAEMEHEPDGLTARSELGDNTGFAPTRRLRAAT